MVADVSPLVGRSFVSNGGNVCRIIKLAEGAVRAQWKTKPVDADRRELVAFVEGVLGPVDTTLNVGLESEAAALSEWIRNKAGRTNA